MSTNKDLIMNKMSKNMQFFVIFATVVGVLVNVLNFYILSKISPSESRVKALETLNDRFMPGELSLEQWKNHDLQHTVIDNKLNLIDTKIDRLLLK